MASNTKTTGNRGLSVITLLKKIFRIGWIKYEPNNKKTYPKNLQRCLVAFKSIPIDPLVPQVSLFLEFEDPKFLKPYGEGKFPHEISHWHLLPETPIQKERE